MKRRLAYGWMVFNSDFFVDDIQPPLSIPLNRLGIDPVLFPQYPRGEAVGRVRFQDGNDSLNDNRTRINAFIRKVDRASGKLNAIIEGLLLAVETRKRWKQRRMNIHDPHRKGTEEKRRKDPHETGHHDKLDTARLKNVDHHSVKILPSGKIFLPDNDRMNAVFFRSFQGVSIVVVAENDLDLRLEHSPFDMIDNGLQIRAAAGNENTYAQRFLHGQMKDTGS